MPVVGLGSRIATSRAARRMTQVELARRAQISPTFVSELENDRRIPGAETLLHIADALGCSLDYLVRGYEYAEHRDREPKSLFAPTA